MLADETPSASSSAGDTKDAEAPRGRLFIIAGPSGSGKSSVTSRLVAKGIAKLSVSYTTREQRSGEVDGVHYRFIAQDEFERLRAANALLESACVHGRWYATSRSDVERDLAAGQAVMLEIDVQGAAQIRASRVQQSSIFILPPSLDALRGRLAARGREEEPEIQRRLAVASSEIAAFSQFDYLVVNDDVEAAAAAVANIIRGRGQRYARERQPELAGRWSAQLAAGAGAP